jgi:hypothetical protein
MRDEEFLAAFEGCTLPQIEWTHAAQVGTLQSVSLGQVSFLPEQ